MKRLALVIVAVLMTVGVCWAELDLGDIIQKLPPLKQGIGYSIIENKIEYLSTIELAKWKGINLEAGYNSSNKVIGVVSYEILKLKDYISLPILDLLEFNLGMYAGVGRIGGDNPPEFDYGVSATILNIKF